MKIACYIGNHAGDTPLVRAGWAITRMVQKGPHADVTHTEAILDEHADGAVDIGSSSLRDKGVRIKEHVRLTPGNWRIFDVPKWDRQDALEWFIEHKGEPYDTRGAFASWLPIVWHWIKRWFCSEAVAASAGMKAPNTYGPALLAAIAEHFGRDVTAEFFKSREHDSATG